MTTPEPAAQQGGAENPPSEQQQGGGQGGQQQDLETPKFSQKWANDFEARLRREYAAKHEKDQELIEKGKEYQSLLAESQPLSERVQALSAESAQKDSTIAEKDLQIRRQQLAWEANLPPAIGRRVQGNTEDEIRADIEALQRELPQLTVQQQQQRSSDLRPNPQQGAPSVNNDRTGSVTAGRDLWSQRHGKKTDAAI